MTSPDGLADPAFVKHELKEKPCTADPTFYSASSLSA